MTLTPILWIKYIFFNHSVGQIIKIRAIWRVLPHQVVTYCQLLVFRPFLHMYVLELDWSLTIHSAYLLSGRLHYFLTIQLQSTIGLYPKQQFKMEKAETKNVFKDFCESTSLHGYSYLFIGNSIFSKIIWTIVILLMTCVGAMFLMNNTVDYMNSTQVTTLETSSAPLKVKIWN